MRSHRLVPLAALLCGGCTTITTLGSARTLDEGEGELSFGAGLQAVTVKDTFEKEGLLGTAPVQTLEGQIRYAVADRTEPGMRLSLSGGNIEAAGDLKIGILRPARNQAGVAISLAPGAAMSFFGTSVRLPLLVGKLGEDGSETIVGVKPGLAWIGWPFLLSARETIGATPYFGASVGHIFRSSPFWAWMVELGGYGTYLPARLAGSSQWLTSAQLGFGVLLDPHARAAPAAGSPPPTGPGRDDRPPAPAAQPPDAPGEGWW
jgi:hypothetical protein